MSVVSLLGQVAAAGSTSPTAPTSPDTSTAAILKLTGKTPVATPGPWPVTNPPQPGAGTSLVDGQIASVPSTTPTPVSAGPMTQNVLAQVRSVPVWVWAVAGGAVLFILWRRR